MNAIRLVLKKLTIRLMLVCTVFMVAGNAWGITFDYPTLLTQFYLGGSLLYTTDDASLCHLTAGNSYPFRLGTVTKKDTVNVTINNVFITVRKIKEQSSLLAEMEHSKQIKIIGGLYDLDTGIVTFYEQRWYYNFIQEPIREFLNLSY